MPTRPINTIVPFIALSTALLWIIGVEQLAFVAITVLLFSALISIQYVSLDTNTKHLSNIFLGFLLLFLFSAFQIEKNFRFLSFARDMSVYISFFLLFITTVSCIRSVRDIAYVTYQLSLVFLSINCLSLSYVALGPWGFETPIAPFLPDSFVETQTGQHMAFKTVGRELPFFGLIDTRLKGVFSSAIHYASIIVLTLPLLFWAQSLYRGLHRALILMSILTSLLILVFTQSRTALGMLPIMASIYLCLIVYRYSLKNSLLNLFTIFSTFFVAIIILGYLFSDDLYDLWYDVFVRHRSGSAESRFTIYELTFRGILEKPLVGWGTQRDIEFLDYPLGSHNWYLSLAYKHGIIAALLIIYFVCITLFCSVSGVLSDKRSFRNLSSAAFIGAFAYFTVALTLEPIVDAIAMHILAVIVAISIRISNIDDPDGSSLHN